ncbi:type III polyketide synthase [Bacillus sp. REN16]|uniref:type III polyketide synthase n=1 Tax=Bacillus sp. REN16 TaxID=2887296 RepID=UPI001E2877B8|nr:3-oxoacyl-[acyl-carrier-protein] synthase III C-terminal domain-containing protein [Bacillus sp. REN16]MCC3358397.1 type III polyketide synthase [Bacillus sp. REN16]
MPKIISVGICNPPNKINQLKTTEFIRELFYEHFPDIDRLIKVFANSEIEERYFSESLEWYGETKSFEEKNNTYIKRAVTFGIEAIHNCLTNQKLLAKQINPDEIDAIFFISSSGIATPSIEARIMNKMNFSPDTKRIPIWGLGCAGGASGLARAFDYCKAYPGAKVLVLAVELCSLTFQKNDFTKSNLIGTSLFADGTACVCIGGDEVELHTASKVLPNFVSSRSTLMADSEDVMGWDVKNTGLHVIFSKDIPSIVKSWLKGNVDKFLHANELEIKDTKHFIAHPGGKKVLDAYEAALEIPSSMTDIARDVLRRQGNMSSVTVLYVLKEFMEKQLGKEGDYGLVTALGPGFSSELILLQWRK